MWKPPSGLQLERHSQQCHQAPSWMVQRLLPAARMPDQRVWEAAHPPWGCRGAQTELRQLLRVQVPLLGRFLVAAHVGLHRGDLLLADFGQSSLAPAAHLAEGGQVGQLQLLEGLVGGLVGARGVPWGILQRIWGFPGGTGPVAAPGACRPLHSEPTARQHLQPVGRHANQRLCWC